MRSPLLKTFRKRWSFWEGRGRSGKTCERAPGSALEFASSPPKDYYDLLFNFGGFPEPLIKQNQRTLRRWHVERVERFIREDIRDLTMIQDIGNLSLLIDLLPERVSSILSVNSLSEDLQVNFRTVSNWIDTFEKLYFCYRVPPYRTRKIASVRKEKKVYLWDWSSIPDAAKKLENMIA